MARNPFIWPEQATKPDSKQEMVIFPLKYATATQVVTLLSHSLPPQDGKAQLSADKRNNQVLVYTTAKKIALIKRIIHQVDLPNTQILIKAQLVSVNTQALRSLGIIFGSSAKHATAASTDYSQNSNTIDIPILSLATQRRLNITLDALAEQGYARIISRPILMTLSRQTAVIESGEEVPYQEKTGEGNTSISFKKATLRLKATPILLPKRRILLHLEVNQDKISEATFNGSPVITTRQITTQVSVGNGETVVLGGIFETSIERTETGIPLLRKLPLIGALFRHRKRIQHRNELLIFVTPQILQKDS